MKALKPISSAVLFSFVASCASVKTFNMPKVEENLNRAFQKSEDISSSMKNDFDEKKLLVDSLSKTKSAAFKESENDLKTRLANMEKNLADAQRHAKTMSEAKGHVTSLGYAKKKISGDEPEYARVEDAVKEFETAAANFTTAAGEYSRETNSMADIVANKKLFFNFDVAEFQKKIQKATGSGQANAKFMDREVQRTEDIRNSFDDESRRAPVEQALTHLQALRREHGQKLQSLADLSAQMNHLSQGQPKIPSTSSNWADVQKVVVETDRASLSLNELFKEFQSRVDKVRSFKSGP